MTERIEISLPLPVMTAVRLMEAISEFFPGALAVAQPSGEQDRKLVIEIPDEPDNVAS